MTLPNINNLSLRKVTTAILIFLVIAGLSMVLIQAKPFAVDEWRLIYNLKFKSPAELFHHLDFVQQFPRVYLVLIKLFSSPFDYSYFTLRFPSFLVGCLSILFAYRLMNQIYFDNRFKYFFLIIIFSSHAFLQHFIEVKQYTMDILLSLLAIWQLKELLLIGSMLVSKNRYAILCLSFLLAPFFSYTYPIAVVPVYVLCILQSVHTVIMAKGLRHTKLYLFHKWLPLSIGAISILIFYVTDVSQVMGDRDMHAYWADQMMQDGFSLKLFITGLYNLFSELGSGLLLETLLGITGFFAFFFALFKIVKHYDRSLNAHITLYALLHILLVLALFIVGKIPLGVARLNAFTIPSIAILIIGLLSAAPKETKLSVAFPKILFIAMAGSILWSNIGGLLQNGYSRKLDIYVNTENAIILASAKKIPILITPTVAYPYDKALNFPGNPNLSFDLCFPPDYSSSSHCISGDNIPGDWVLKTFPAYKAADNIPVYAINGIDKLEDCIAVLPASIKTFMVGDGTSYKIMTR